MSNRNFVFFVLLLFFLGNRNMFSITYYDSIDINNLEQVSNVTSSFIRTGEFKKAQGLINFGLEMTKNQEIKTNLKYHLADCYFYQQKYDSAQQIYLQVYPQFKKYQDTLRMAQSLSSIGLIYGIKEDITNQLDYFLMEYELLEEVENLSFSLKKEKVALMINMLIVYANQDDYEEIINNASETLELAEEINDSSYIGVIYNNVGEAYEKNGDTKQAMQYYQKASDIFLSIGQDFYNLSVFTNMASIYENVYGDFDSALYLYRRSIAGFNRMDYKLGIVNAELGIASVYLKQNKLIRTEKLLLNVIEISKEYEFNESLLEAYDRIASLYSIKNNNEKAYLFSKLYQELNDSIYSNKRQRQLVELRSRYYLVKKENEIGKLQADKLTREIQLLNANRRVHVFIYISVFLLIIMLSFMFFYSNKQRVNKELTKKNKQISLMNEKLSKSRVELELANKAKNRLFSIIAHDLRSPFNAIIGFSSILQEQFDQLDDNEKKEFVNLICTSSKHTVDLLENLLEWSRTQSNGIVYKPSMVSLAEIIGNTINLLQVSAEEKSVELRNEVCDFNFLADKQMLGTIFRNIINNGIKFTPKGGVVTIKSRVENDWLTIEINDTGVGIPAEIINKIFDISANYNTKGTNNEKGTGLGLIICKEFVTHHKGHIWIESEEGIGSSFFIKLPI